MAQPYQDSIRGVPANTKQEQASDAEEKHRKALQVPEYEDPFGNEEFAEVRYRTLHWW